MYRRRWHYLAFALCLFIRPLPAAAIPPPDIIFQLAGQLGTVLSAMAVLLAALLLPFKLFWQQYLRRLPRLVWIIAGIVLLTLVIGVVICMSVAETDEGETELTIEEEIMAIIRAEHNAMPYTDGRPNVTESAFFKANKDLPVTISNADFQAVLSSNRPAFFLDPREQEEVDIGQFPGSVHIRYADLRTGAWRQLPTDRVVYVFCYGGARGQVISEFLRSRGIVAQALDEGASAWVEQGGRWNGTIDFYGHYRDTRYLHRMTPQERDDALAQGATPVDTRLWEEFEDGHIEGSIHMPIVYLPSNILADAMVEVPVDRPFITICADVSTCFDARVAAIHLEKEGHDFIGVYDATEYPADTALESQRSFPW